MTGIARNRVVVTGRFQMDYTLHRAGSTTHLKIVLVSLVAATVVVAVGINARTSTDTASGPAVAKAGQPPAFAGKDGATVR
jgi:hypothetical protein